jgi:hypothetical protein
VSLAGFSTWARQPLERRLLQRLRVAQDHHAPVGEHRQCLEGTRQARHIALRAAQLFEVEVPRGGIGRRGDQRPDLLLLQEVIRAVEQVDRVQAAALERRLERLHRHGCHTAGI